MPREMPRRAFGWRVGRKIYATELGAYYRIAKAIVVARYHPMIDQDRFEDDNIAGALEISVAELEHRRRRMTALFGSRGEFDTKRWRALVRRLAKFLCFVDHRRTDQEQLLRALSPAELDREYHDTDRLAMDAASRLVLIQRIAKESPR